MIWRMVGVVALWAVVALWGASARAESPSTSASTSDALREANAAALAGDWAEVASRVDPLFHRSLSRADLAEAHRLAGIAAFFAQRLAEAEGHLLAYLRSEQGGQLDPALYPPDVVQFFSDVASRHRAELVALHTPPPRRLWFYNFLPPIGQFQNGDRTKAYVLGGVLGALLITNLTTYYYLREWCNHTQGPAGGALTCTEGSSTGTTHLARQIRPTNIITGLAFWAVYAYSVYDGFAGYRRVSRERALQPYVSASVESGAQEGIVGVLGRF
jgi:hypothetical protein